MDTMGIEFHVVKCVFEVILQGIQAVEDSIVEGLLAQFIPEMLDRVQLW